MTTARTFQRARRPEHKRQRQDAILAAARQLALEAGVRNVNLTDIADQVGIHKSALLRYFETREQIFLELAAESWLDWAQALHAELDDATPAKAGLDDATPAKAGLDDATPAKAGLDDAPAKAGLDDATPAKAGLVAGAFARSFADRPLLCDLIAHIALNLERHVSAGAVRRYKLTSLGVISDVTDLVHRLLPDLTPVECREFVSTMATLAGSLWQIANPAPAIARLYASDPELAQACVDLVPRLRRTATIMLAGLIPSREHP